MKERKETQTELFNIIQDISAETGTMINPRVKYSRDRYRTMMNTIKNENVDFLMLGWHGRLNVSKISRSMVGQLVRKAPCKVGVLKDRGLDQICKILVPFRGSEHAEFGLDLAGDFSETEDCLVTILRVVKPGTDVEKEKSRAKKEVDKILPEDRQVNYEIKVVENNVVAEGIVEEANQGGYDLTIIGASKEWRFKNILFGSIPDVVADSTKSSVLMVRTYDKKISKEVEKVSKEDQEKAEKSDEPEKI